MSARKLVQKPTSRVTILGIPVDTVTVAEAVDKFRSFIKLRQRALVCSLNVDLCMRVQRDPELRDVYLSANLILVDGTPMMWAASFLGTPLPERVSGSDFLPAFCSVAANEGFSVFLLGGAPGVAARAAAWLEERNPSLRIAGTYSPPMGFERDETENVRTIDRVRRARPDVLFAALGPSKQEKWLTRFRHAMDVPVSMGVGSSFDYLAGRLRRAPLWMQRAGLEWSYRLAQEPRRLWRRYLIENPPFVYHVIKEHILTYVPSKWES